MQLYSIAEISDSGLMFSVAPVAMIIGSVAETPGQSDSSDLKSSGTPSDMTTFASNVPQKNLQCCFKLIKNCCDAQNYFCFCFMLLQLLAEKYRTLLCSILIELLELY